jgi:hypothetical protein
MKGRGMPYLLEPSYSFSPRTGKTSYFFFSLKEDSYNPLLQQLAADDLVSSDESNYSGTNPTYEEVSIQNEVIPRSNPKCLVPS